MPELAYISYYTNNARYRDFANAGFRLYSVPIFFSSQTINERTRMTYLSPGIYDGEEPDYSEADRRVRDILAARPDAYIFPRVNVSLPVRWEKEHPDELLTSGYAEHRRSCFASETWLEESKRLLRDYIAHVESSDYCDSIIGYQISSGNTEEWFPFDFGIGCCDGKRTQELISRERIDRDSGEFYERMSRLFAETIIELCGVAKECTSSRLVTGSFYGYTMFVPDRTSCHHGMKYILESDKIDFLCSPVSYAELRRPGMDHANMMCIDSLKLHGKLYMAENDTRTHLSKPPNSLPAYNGPIWFGHSKEVTLEILKMHFSRALTHGHGMWWFDMWGGWYDAPDYMALMKRSREIFAKAREKPGESVSELAVLIDEGSYAFIDPASGRQNIGLTVIKLLGYLGAPYDVYLAEDFETVADRYKAYIFVEPSETMLLNECIRKASKPYMLFTPDDVNITTEDIREFCRNKGIHIYTDRKATIYADSRFVFIHTGEAGEYIIDSPRQLEHTDIITGREISFPLKLGEGQSLLFQTKNVKNFQEMLVCQ